MYSHRECDTILCCNDSVFIQRKYIVDLHKIQRKQQTLDGELNTNIINRKLKLDITVT